MVRQPFVTIGSRFVAVEIDVFVFHGSPKVFDEHGVERGSATVHAGRHASFRESRACNPVTQLPARSASSNGCGGRTIFSKYKVDRAQWLKQHFEFYNGERRYQGLGYRTPWDVFHDRRNRSDSQRQRELLSHAIAN